MSYYTSAILDVDEIAFEMETEMLNQAFECLEKTHRQKMTAIKYGDGIYPFTMEAVQNAFDEEMTVYTEGVKDLWNKFIAAIRKMINKILDFLAPNRRKKNLPAQVEVENDPKALGGVMEKISAICSDITKVTDENGNLDTDLLAKKLGIAIGAGAAAATVVASLRKTYQKPKRKQNTQKVVNDGTFMTAAAKKVDVALLNMQGYVASGETVDDDAKSHEVVVDTKVVKTGKKKVSAGAVAFFRSLVSSVASDGVKCSREIASQINEGDVVYQKTVTLDHQMDSALKARIDEMKKKDSNVESKFWEVINHGIEIGAIAKAPHKLSIDVSMAAILNKSDNDRVIGFCKKVMNESVEEASDESLVFEYIGFEDSVSAHDTFSSINSENKESEDL